MARPIGDERAGPPDNAIDLLLWGLALLAVVVTLFLSFGPTPPGAESFPGADKLMHAWAYFVTVLLVLLAGVWRPGRGPGPLAGKAWLIVVVAIVGGGMIEILQHYVTRFADVFDWVADATGALLALAALRALSRAGGTPYPERAADSRGAPGA